jgi:aspartate/methionine/tyrosine aminotransferase
MQFPERYSNLPEYAFPRLRSLLDAHAPGGPVLHMSIGEPKHPFPDWVEEILAANAAGYGRYPPNDGSPEMLEAIAGWLQRRYGVTLDADRQVMALNGTREGLYNAAMALLPEEKRGKRPVVLLPNPFYQVYMIAALSTGAEPVFVPASADAGFLPDFAALPAEVLERAVAAYICSPSNPQGAIAGPDYWRDLLALADRHDFRIFSDECYSEIYRGDTPPPGALQMAAEAGTDPERVTVFHSLSKRSNLPGLRSGFVAGGPESMARIKRLRAYAGAPLPIATQAVSAAVWADEAHVVENRRRYRAKYDMADAAFRDIPGWQAPEAGFFLWLPVRDGEAATLKLWRETGVRVLPGAYLARDVDGVNPGAGYVRAAMVAPEDELRRGLQALAESLEEVR